MPTRNVKLTDELDHFVATKVKSEGVQPHISRLLP